MPERCVAARCGNVKDPDRNISMHKIPFFGDVCPIKKKRRKKWVDFVLERRKMWVPGKTSSLCSEHFAPDDFQRPLNKEVNLKRDLKKDEIGVCVFPSIHAKRKGEDDEPPSKKRREARMIARSAKARLKTLQEPEATSIVYPSTGILAAQTVQAENSQDIPINPYTSSQSEEGQHGTCNGGFQEESGLEPEATCSANMIHEDFCYVQDAEESEPFTQVDKSTQTLADQRCSILSHEMEVLKGQLSAVRQSLKTSKDKKRQLKRKVELLTRKLQEAANNGFEENVKSKESCDTNNQDTCIGEEKDIEEEDDTETVEEEPDFSSDAEFFSESGGDTETEDEEKETNDRSIPLSSNNDIRTEPKHIVFLSKLLLLFQFCHLCRTGNKPDVTATQSGTAVTIRTTCSNPGCRKEFTWTSQPLMPGTKLPAGNFLICMATLFAGGSFTKMKTIFQHMGLACVSLNTFFKHQRTWLFPTVHLFWKRYQANLFSQLKVLGDLTIAGDGRHDSMGHCAKYGAYTIFCCTLPRIIHFALVQRNQAGSSPAMEFMGFQKCIDFLLGCGLVITAFISDRHTQIASHMKNVLTHIKHYFDLWHLKKKITKLLSKISKEKGNEDLRPWIKPCERHLYWSATTTSDGNGKVIWAKFKSFLSHIVNRHTDLDEPLFNKCAHGDIPDRTWINPDDIVYEKTKKALTADSLKKGIMQASPSAQTDCLEGFHSVLNFFAPKIIAYSYLGMYCRHILAALHFNYNLHREEKVNKDGSVPLKVTYPKFKNGEATVRNLKIKPIFDYVGELFQFFMTLSKQQLQDACIELKNMVPDPMNTMLEKQPREEAIRKRTERMRMVAKDVPPTAPARGPTSSERRQQPSRALPRCSICKNPMRGHNSITDCPRNRKD